MKIPVSAATTFLVAPLVAAPVAAQGTAGKAVTTSEMSSPSKTVVIKGAEHVAMSTPGVTERARRDLPKAKAWQQGDTIHEVPWLYPRLQEKRALRRIHRRREP